MSTFLRAVVAPILAAVVSFLIAACGEGIWGMLAIINLHDHPEWPWAVPVMAVLLAGLLAYLAGYGPPSSTSASRRALLRWNALPFPVFFWAVFAGLLADIALGGAWITTSDLIHIPPGITPSMRGVPLKTEIAFLVMASLAAPLTEEAAFRGYAMGILHKAWGWAPAAIVVSSLLFALAHVTQGLFVPKLGLYFVGGMIFGTVAYLTNSLYAAMIVHSVADFEGFLLLWPHDAHPHALIGEGGHDPLFFPAIAAAVVVTPLAIAALYRLSRMTSGARFRLSGRPK
jgi:membrane protease YdiL (CAAX protease family)